MIKGLVQVTCLLIAVHGVWCADPCASKGDDTRLPYVTPVAAVPATDCLKFVECQNGISTTIDCPINYYYDDGSKSCVMGRGVCTDLLAGGSSGQTCTSLTSYIPGDDCHSYIPCVEDDPALGTFKKGTEVNCAVDSPTTPNLNPYGATGPDCTTDPLWTCKAKSFLPNCALQKNDDYIGDPASCDGFYTCIDGERVKGHCANGLHFNPASKSCIYKENSKCNVPAASASPTLVDICKGKKGSFVADPNSCQAYYYCVSETLPSQGFCAKYFVNGKCVTSTTPPANCGCETVMADLGPTDVIQVPSANPNQYWKCSFAGAELRTCPTGTVYNEAEESCE